MQEVRLDSVGDDRVPLLDAALQLFNHVLVISVLVLAEPGCVWFHVVRQFFRFMDRLEGLLEIDLLFRPLIALFDLGQEALAFVERGCMHCDVRRESGIHATMIDLLLSSLF